MSNPEFLSSSSPTIPLLEEPTSLRDISWLTPTIGALFAVGSWLFTENPAITAAVGLSAAGAFLGSSLAEHTIRRVKTDQSQPLKAKLNRNLANLEYGLAGGIGFGAIAGLVSNRVDFTIGGIAVGAALGALSVGGRINELFKGHA